jgi:NAD(P)-dependent dehydrogenase (short-subunit alcohol dehydrogenase family)
LWFTDIAEHPARAGSRSRSMVAHCASKGAVTSMTKQLAVEGGPDGFRANCIVPGLVQTAATRRLVGQADRCQRRLSHEPCLGGSACPPTSLGARWWIALASRADSPWSMPRPASGR